MSDYRNPFIAEAMKVLGYVNRFSRGIYQVQKELEENGNGQASFDFSLITAFRVVENVSQKYFEEGFGGETSKGYPRNYPRNYPRKDFSGYSGKARNYSKGVGSIYRHYS